MTHKRAIILIFGFGFLLRLVYILYTGILVRQHDLSSFGTPVEAGGKGHATYIEYFYERFRLPDFDVRRVFQFYHPPLHHMISALWLRLQTGLGIEYAAALENLQILTLFYSSACMLLSYRIFGYLKLKGAALIAACAVIAVHPTFLMLAGSVNNDILCITLVLASVVAAFRWYEKPTFPRIILLALCIGLAMMAKLSGGIVAIAVALLMLLRLIYRKISVKRLLAQYTVFGVICIPTALWWQIRNLVLFDVPLGYVPRLSESADQYLGNYSVWERFFDFSMRTPWDAYQASATYQTLYGYEFFEHNIFYGALKSSLFGEYYIGKNSPIFSGLAAVLFYARILMFAGAVVGAVYLIYKLVRSIRKPQAFLEEFGTGRALPCFMLLFEAALLVTYVQFCFAYPHFCSMDMRYIVPVLVIHAFFFGIFLQKMQKKGTRSARILCWCAGIVTAVFCIGSACFYVFAV